VSQWAGSHLVESTVTVESVATAVESVPVESSLVDPQETKRETTANINNSFFIVYFFLFLFIYAILKQKFSQI
jgi:hypothetical protein